MSRDPFGTAGLRSAVLEAWRRSPARLREDANTEEDHARGYYRDRVVVELAQNAADAATRSGGRGRLLLRVTRVAGRDVLLAANTGAPLDAAGVAALASMRASSKRDEAGLVGRFGVGFAAVRSVADEAVVVSSAGAVRFSVARTRALLAEEPGLADELSRRGDALPALRLPFDADDGGLPGTAPEADDGAHPEPDPVPDPDLDGPRSADTGPAVRALLDLASSLVEHDGAGRAAWSTVVGLVLRDAEAAASVRAQLAALGDPLLLALPGLGEFVVETPEGSFAVADVEERWHVARASGTAAPELLADRPTEERAASGWQVAWALPRSGTQREGVVFAPTPTLEPLTLPALLVATLPLDPTRRHVARGPLTDELVQRAGEVYARLGELLAAKGRNPLDLVPLGLPAGELDARLRESALAALAAAPILTVGEERDLGTAGTDPEQPRPNPDAGQVAPRDTDPEQPRPNPDARQAAPRDTDAEPPRANTAARRVAPRDASALAGELGQDSGAVAALARAAENLVLLTPGDEPRAAALGVRIRPVGDVVDELAALPSPAAWRDLYAALAPAAHDPAVRESLGALGVPLADGRTVRGARGVLLVRDEIDVALLAPWGVRVVHPEAEHELLERLGAQRVDAAGLLAHDAVRAAVAAASDDDGLAAELVPVLLDIVAAATALPAWIGELPLPEDGGGFAPARELVLAGSLADRLLDPDVVGTLDPSAAQRWPVAARLVLSELRTVTIPDVVTGPSLLDDDDAPHGWHHYLEELSEQLGPDVALGDLEAVADLDAVRPDAWPAALRALDEHPETHRAVTRPVRGALSYTAWWLRHEGPELLDGPFALEPMLEPLLGAMPRELEGLSEAMLRALGGVAALEELEAEDWSAVELGREGDAVDPVTARAVWDALATLRGSEDVPELLPAVVGPERIVLAEADAVVLVPGPHWFARTDVGPMLPVPADSLDELARRLDLARPTARGVVTSRGAQAPVPAEVRALLPGAPAAWTEHEDLRVDGRPVEWWPPAHAVHLAGLARALAWSSGHWELRGIAELALTEPGRAAELAVEIAARAVPRPRPRREPEDGGRDASS